MSACIACGGSRWSPLPDPQPARSMLSDLRVIPEPLAKEACQSCSLVRRAAPLRPGLFEHGYHLYDHAPGMPRESARQEAYAHWLSAEVPSPPASILDLGCGNGSLLLALRQHWPSALLRGIDPSPESVARARMAGIDARCGRAETTGVGRSDLVISVNVIEHVESPVDFLRSMDALVAPAGSLLLVCPDGGRAWLELLFADHRWSFAASHLGRIATAAGLTVVGSTSAPSELGFFQLIRLSRQGTGDTLSSTADDLADSKRRYLQAWARLERDLLARIEGAPSLACFGMGEAAALLRAYTPEVWKRVKVCLVDSPEQPTFGDVPVIDYTGEPIEWPVLLGVRPAAQPAIAQGLCASGCSVIRWDDWIAA